jgi:hypothetical protein
MLGQVWLRPRPVVFGDLRGRITVRDDFDEWTSQDELDWYGA